jgi:hypothetical protein
MTTTFVSAAQMMSQVMGMTGYGFAVIDHPISSASDDDLLRMARSTIEQIRPLLLQAR